MIQGVIEELSPVTKAPSAGVAVCLLDQSQPCSTTDAAGQYRVEPVPLGVRTGITLTRQGFLSVLIPMIVPESQPISVANTSITSESTTGLLSQMAGLTWPMAAGEGELAVVVREAVTGEPMLAGAVIEVVSTTPEAIVYFDASSRPDPTLGATTAGGIALVGGLPEGLARVRVTLPGGTCLPVWGYAGDGGDIEVPVRAGWLSQVLVMCAAP